MDIKKELLYSNAFLNLPFSARCGFIYFISKIPDKPIKFTYEEAVCLGFSRPTFSGIIKALVGCGFIKVTTVGSGGNGVVKSSSYELSENWKTWEPPTPVTVTPKEKHKEKTKVTPLLRYKVLRRDNFYCQTCGKTGKDGQLVVDHIFPISKGGKTIMDNLRTLCVECNDGKRSRIE